jgi:hypothetical protein
MSGRLLFSRRIRKYRYDPENNMLVIEFSGRIVKKYGGVPPQLYEGLSKTEDPDQFYQEKIDGQFIVL